MPRPPPFHVPRWPSPQWDEGPPGMHPPAPQAFSYFSPPQPQPPPPFVAPYLPVNNCQPGVPFPWAPGLGAFPAGQAEVRRDIRAEGIDRPHVRANSSGVGVDRLQIQSPISERAGKGVYTSVKSPILSIDAIDEIAASLKEQMIAEGKAVTYVRLAKEVPASLGRHGWEEMQMRPYDVPTLSKLQGLENKVHAFIHTYISVRSITTLYDLAAALAAEEGVPDFEHLEIGPLLSFPIIQRYFSPPANITKVPKITTEELVDCLAKYATGNDRGKKVEMKGFMEYLAKEKDVNGPEELCVRVQALGRYLHFIFKMVRTEREQAEKWEREYQRKSRQKEQSLRNSHFKRMDKLIQQKAHLDSEEEELSQEECTLSEDPQASAWDEQRVRLEVWKQPLVKAKPKAKSLIMGPKDLKGFVKKWKGKAKSANSPAQLIEEFLPQLQSDTPTKAKKELQRRQKVFKVLSGGFQGLVTLGLERLLGSEREASLYELLQKEEHKSNAVAIAPVDVDEPELEKGTPDKDQTDTLLSSAIQSFERIKSTSPDLPPPLALFKELQASVAQHSDCSLLQVLVANSSRLPQDLAQALGFSESRHLGVLRNEKPVLALVRQTLDSAHEEECIEVLKKEFPDFDFDVKALLEMAKGTPRGSVVYSLALLASESSRGSGIAGAIPEEEIVRVIENTPFLTNIASFTQWQSVFEPSEGPLVDFLSKLSQHLFLCLSDGRIFRLPPSASPEKFLKASIRGDSVESVTQILSIISLHGSIKTTPKALLQAQAESALSVLGAESTRFVKECLEVSPPEFRCFLGEVLLSEMDEEKERGMLEKCETPEQYSALHGIGLRKGIRLWTEHYVTRVVKGGAESAEGDESAEGAESAAGEVQVAKENERTQEEKNVKVPNDEIQRSESSSKAQGVLVKVTERLGKVAEDVNMDPEGLLRTSDSDSEEALAGFLSSEEALAKAVVDEIRREEFGIDDAESAGAESALLRRQHARIGRALQRLSTELYSTDSHFVLELVQNADDNFYPADVIPTLAFVLSPTQISVLNNEIGFSERNVRALCDIGRSTKGKGVSGYIGQKGIGFKSVFRVTDAPAIHSRGFHISFNVSQAHGHLGLILPTWLPPPEALDFPSTPTLGPTLWPTRIDLPLKPPLRDLNAKFLDVQPSLLLFLHRLRKIVISNGDSLRIMQRKDLSESLVRLEDTSGGSDWLTVRRTLHPPKEVSRDGIRSTEIALAFPLKVSDTGLYTAAPSRQKLFAFLPLRSYGFKFIAQGNWVLPSSREDVDHDSAWNQWLRGELVDFLVDSLAEFLEVSPGKALPEAVNSFLQFVPLEGEVLGFFGGVPRMVLSKLRRKECIPVEGSEGKLVLPCQVLMAPDSRIQDLIPPSLLKQHSGLYYLHPAIAISEHLQTALGVSHLTSQFLLNLLCSIVRSNPKPSFAFLANFVCLLDRTKDIAKHSSDLKRMAFLPLSDGSYAKPDSTVWLPKESALANRPLLAKDIRVVSEEFLAQAKQEGCESAVLNLLRKLGVSELSVHDVVEKHILQNMKRTVDAETLIEYLKAIKEHCETSCKLCDKDWLESLEVLVVCSSGRVLSPRQEPVHFSKAFENPVPLKIPTWNTVSSAYLKNTNDVASWRNFLRILGVRDLAQLKQVSADPPHPDLQKGDTSCVLDWKWDELVALLDSPSHLLRSLDLVFEAELSEYTTARIFRGSEISREVPASWVLTLQERKWLLAKGENGMFRPRDLWFRCPEIERFWGDNGKYVDAVIKNENLLRVLGVKSEVSAEDALEHLKRWSAKKEMSASTLQFTHLYTLLSTLHFPSDAPLIWVPSKQTTSKAIGTFYQPNRLCWSDPTGLLSSSLSPHYPFLESFFLQTLKVPRTPTIEQVALALEKLATSAEPEEETLRKAEKAFEYVGGVLSLSEGGCGSERGVKVLAQKRIFPTTCDNWVSLEETNLFIPDDKKLAKLFNSSAKFLNVKLKDEVCRSLGIKRISSAVEKEVLSYGNHFNTELGSLVISTLPYAQRYLYHRHANLYQNLVNQGVQERLKSFKCVLSDDLFVIYRLGTVKSPDREAVKAILQSKGPSLYIAKDHTKDYSIVFSELSRLFFEGEADRPLATFLHLLTLLLTSASTEETERFVRGGQDIPPLPASEHPWGASSPLQVFANPQLAETESLSGEIETKSETPSRKRPREVWPPPRPVNLETPPGVGLSEGLETIGLDLPGVKRRKSELSAEDEELRRPSLGTGSLVPKATDFEPARLRGELNTLPEGVKEVVGRSGEEVVFKHLVEKFGREAVRWMNEEGESGACFDIVLAMPGGEKQYLEVKATRSNDKALFEVSGREWEFALQEGARFHFVRVYGAGAEASQVRLVRISDPASQWSEGKIKLCVHL